jgi:outer membrane protein assembly factor BamE (lipoprotein component of BamABCDE complex)
MRHSTLTRLTPLLCAASLAVLAAACAPITAFQGYQPVDSRPADIKVTDDSKMTVRTKLGSPTTVSAFEPNIWYYMAQTTDQFGAYTPRTRSREIVAITFDKTSDKVSRVDTITAKDGRVIAFNGRVTPTVGRELGIFEQLISNLGTTLLPQPDDDPGRRPNQ